MSNATSSTAEPLSTVAAAVSGADIATMVQTLLDANIEDLEADWDRQKGEIEGEEKQFPESNDDLTVSEIWNISNKPRSRITGLVLLGRKGSVPWDMVQTGVTGLVYRDVLDQYGQDNPTYRLYAKQESARALSHVMKYGASLASGVRQVPPTGSTSQVPTQAPSQPQDQGEEK